MISRSLLCSQLLVRTNLVVPSCCSLSTSFPAFGKAEAKSSKESLVLVKTLNGVTTLTMNNPKKLNGWTTSMMTRLREAMDQAAADKDTKVAIVTGELLFFFKLKIFNLLNTCVGIAASF